MERVGPSPGQGCWAFQVALALKNPPATGGDVRDTVQLLGWEDSPGGRHDNPL